MTRATTEQKSKWLFANAELMLVLLLGFLYCLMAIFGRGAFWISFEKVNLFFILFTFPLIFVVNTYLLLPLFIKKHKWWLYIFALVAIQLMLESSRLFFSTSPTSSIFGKQDTTTSFIFAVAASWLFVSIRDWLINIRVIEKLKSEKLHSELAFLKVQVDPHFLFNTLNSMYALALEENSPKTADSIIKLSALMRYNLHDSNEEFVSIEKEIDYIEKYIALQKLRLNENNQINLSVKFADNNDLSNQIAPLILIPIVENVFKYGISPSEATEISINICINSDLIELKTENTIVANSDNHTLKGIGLRNIQHRLDLLYPNHYELKTDKANNIYKTSLKIKLQK